MEWATNIWHHVIRKEGVIHMKKKLAALGLVAALALGILAGCGGGGNTAKLTINLGENGAFVFNPSTLTVKKGDNVEVTLVNKDTAAEHSFVATDLNAKSPKVAAGATQTYTFKADKEGTFDFWCDVPGHKEGNMVGKITVTP